MAGTDFTDVVRWRKAPESVVSTCNAGRGATLHVAQFDPPSKGERTLPNSGDKPHLVISFTGPIEHHATKYLRNWICMVAAGDFGSLTLLLSSMGGSLVDGFSLYNLLRSLRCDVTAVNTGTVESIAVPIFLAASKRIACPNTRFLLHDFTWTFGEKERLTPNLIEERSAGLAFDKKAYRAVIVDRCPNLSDAQLDDLKLFEKPIIMDTAAALKAGLIEEVTQYTIPAACRVVNMDF